MITIGRPPSGVYLGGVYSVDDPGQATTPLSAPRSIPRQTFGTPQIGTARVGNRGTVYGGQTGPLTDATMEQTGSLTGQILSRGQATRYIAPKRSRLKVILVATVSAVAFIAIIGGIVYALAGDFLRALLHTIIHLG
jgi:hypothetical protein